MPENHRTSDEDNQRYLLSNHNFKGMPERSQGWILSSPHASADFADFFRDGGEIQIGTRTGLPYYHPLNPPKIVVDAGTYNLLLRSDASLYIEIEREMFANLAHEIGHHRHNTATELFKGQTAEEYVQYRSELEARTVFNAFPIFDELQKNDPEFEPKWSGIGYGRGAGVESAAIYQRWREGRIDEASAIAQLAKPIPDFSYSRDDFTGNQLKTWREYYLHDFENLKRTNPKHPGHPDHPMLESIRDGVRKIDVGVGKPFDESSERLSHGLLVACKEGGLCRVDHVVMGTNSKNLFAVEGAMHDPAHTRVHVAVEQAIRTPVDQSDDKLLAVNQMLSQHLAQQQNLAMGPQDPNRSGPRFTM